jgi:hypothetical protein
VSTYNGEIIEISLGENQQRQAVIACLPQAVPAPGQYLQAHPPADLDAPLPASLFLGGEVETKGEKAQFTTAAPVPAHWQPGMALSLRGPLGHGFQLPPTASRLALVALDTNLTRLIPLIDSQPGQEIALFTDAPLPRLPSQVEANPLRALTDAWNWADLLLFDGPAPAYQNLPALLGIPQNTPFPCPAQALVHIEMPCGALAECGVCAVTGQRKKTLLACEDGPVFELQPGGLVKKIT